MQPKIIQMGVLERPVHLKSSDLEAFLEEEGSENVLGVSHTPAACSFPGENARSWGALGEAR